MSEVSVIGLDLAKHVLQVHGADASGRVVLRKKLRRALPTLLVIREGALVMHPSSIDPVPEETARVAQAAFRRGTLLMRVRDEIEVLYDDTMIATLYDAQGQSAMAPWRLALVTLFQFLENLSDRQAAEARRRASDRASRSGLLHRPGRLWHRLLVHGLSCAMQFDTLKIDRSYVSKVSASTNGAAVMDGLISIARGLDLRVV